jgi:hypothetical protein
MSPRPVTLRQVAERSDNLEEFGRHFRDWQHELRRFSSRAEILRAIAEKPPLVAGRFQQGAVADAWLGANAEYLAGKLRLPVPAWVSARQRVAPEPWFAVDERSAAARLAALRDSPAPFKKRNLFTPTVDLPLGLRAGRPVKSAEHKRGANAERQRRFREKLRAELQQLRGAAG